MAEKIKRVLKQKIGDEFAQEDIAGEWERPGPRPDPDAAGIAAALSQITKRTKTGFVIDWKPEWLKKTGLTAFSFFFFQDGLAVDSFNRDQDEMDALKDDLTQEQRQEIAKKTVLCGQNGITYLPLGPDEELDMVQLAAKIGKTTYKKGAKPVGRTASKSGDGIEEEGNDEF